MCRNYLQTIFIIWFMLRSRFEFCEAGVSMKLKLVLRETIKFNLNQNQFRYLVNYETV